MVTAADFNTDLLQDLSDELEDKRDSCTQHLLKLEENPQNIDAINLLFRDVHTVKGDLGIMGIHQYLPLIQSIEDVLDALRQKKLTYTPTLGDALLLSLDLVYGELHLFLESQDDFNADYYQQVADMVSNICDESEERVLQATRAVIRTLAPETAKESVIEGSPDLCTPSHSEYFSEKEINEEVAFFLQLSLLTDQRMHKGSGRTERQFLLAMTMNNLAGNPIDNNQLQAAVYLHDVAMAFIPKGMMQKSTALSEEDWNTIKRHMEISHQLISPYEIWQEAATMIIQHHERIDGTGYPNQLVGDEIHDGAKVLAIIDSFEAITQGRNYQVSEQRPMMRAIMEINEYAGTRYCPKWVKRFNQAVKQLHVKKPKT